MKSLLLFASIISLLISCALKKEAFTKQVIADFNLDTEEKMRDVQFFISQTIILDQELLSDSLNITENGALIASSSSKKETIVIPAGTKCIFESFGTKGEILVRFETGDKKTLIFSSKTEGNRDTRYNFEADWSAAGGPKVNYGGNVYKVNLNRSFARSAYLIVVKKNLQKNKRKQRVIKGLKV